MSHLTTNTSRAERISHKNYDALSGVDIDGCADLPINGGVLLLVCTGCAEARNNGETLAMSDGREPWSELPGADVAWNGNEPFFLDVDCDGCGDRLAGDRHGFTLFSA